MSSGFEEHGMNMVPQGPEEELVGEIKEEDTPEIMDTLRSLRAEIRRCKEDNAYIVREQA